MRELSGTRETYETVAEEYEIRHSDRSVVASPRDSFLDAVPGTRLLDVGCGPGWETATFANRGYDVLGVDLTERFSRMTDERADGANVAQMDMRQLAVEDDQVDGVWACASFLHVPREDATDTLAEFARVLRPNGVVALSVKHGDGTRTGNGYDEDARQFTLYREPELRDRLETAGLTPTSAKVDDDWLQVFARA